MAEVTEPRRLVFYEGHPAEVLDATNDRLIARLVEAGIDAGWTRRLPRDLGAGDVLVAHRTFRTPYPMPEVCLLGQRLTNRRERLLVCEDAGVPVAQWATPERAEEVLALFERWDTDAVLLKRDRSYRRRGVALLTPGDPVPPYDPTADVFQRVLRGDPRTYKVAVFWDTAIAVRVMGTRSVFDPEFVPALSTQYLVYPPPPELLELASRLGRAFLGYGAGYMSIDFMREGDRWYVIEVNPCGVGRRTSWRLWPGLYGDRYALGVQRWLESGPTFEPITTMIARAATLRHLPGGC